jgi:hypothetical protein
MIYIYLHYIFLRMALIFEMKNYIKLIIVKNV